jgi:DNA invertase Pin-like site-specific DNA recombinase
MGQMGKIGAYKLTEEKAQIIKQLLETGDYTHQQIGDFFGVSREHITKINQGQRWNEEIRQYELKRSNDFRQFTDPKPRKNYGIKITLPDGTKLDL